MTLLLLFLALLPSGPEPFAEGDRLFERMQYADAVAQYSNKRPLAALDAGSAWRVARAYICLGDVSPKKEQEHYYRKALEATSSAIVRDSLNADLHCWYAVSLGYIALFEGSRTKVEYCRRIQRSLERAVALDPANDVAYSVLGTFYRMLAKVSWLERQLADLLLGGLPAGGYAEAERMLKRAVSIAPEVLRHQYELGLVYYETGRKEQGAAVFRHALTLPMTLASDEQRITAMKERLP